MSKIYLVAIAFIIASVFAPTTQAQTYSGEAVFPDVNYTETIFPLDPDTGMQIEVTCMGTSSTSFSNMVVELSAPSMSFNFDGQRTNVTGTDARFCIDSQFSFPFQVANVAVSGLGVIGQNTSGSLTIDLLFSSDGSRLEGAVTNIGALPGQEFGQASLSLTSIDSVDLDIKRFDVKKPKLGGGKCNKQPKPRKVSLTVVNNGDVESPRRATVVGFLAGLPRIEFYSAQIMVNAPVGGDAVKWEFPAYVYPGTATFWEATIDDDDPDRDFSTRVIDLLGGNCP